jgi:hypothetical protein
VSNDEPTTQGAPGVAAEEAVPRLPRGRGIKLSRLELLRVVGLGGVLVFLIVTQRPCANAVSSFVTGFDDPGAASPRPPPRAVDAPAAAGPEGAAAGSAGAAPGGSELDRYEPLRPDMTDDEIKAAIERARARAGSGETP